MNDTYMGFLWDGKEKPMEKTDELEVVSIDMGELAKMVAKELPAATVDSTGEVTELDTPPIDIVDKFTEGLIGIEAYCIGNVLEELWYYKQDQSTESLQYAIDYLETLIKNSEKKD